jgi:heme-degrading monooxygenase HmoA
MANERSGNQPTIQITIVEPETGKTDETVSLMKERAHFMATQPGFISITLHVSLDRGRIVNYVRWENRQLLEAAHSSPKFRKEWETLEEITDDIEPDLYTIVHQAEKA